VGVALAGCGFQSAASPVDATVAVDSLPGSGGTADAAIDAPGPVALTCMERWRNNKLDFAKPATLAKQASSDASERDPWVSSDGKRLYYAVDPNGGDDTSDLYFALRATPSDPFGDGARLTNLDTTFSDDRASLSDDEKTLVLASDRRNNTAKIYYVDRENTSGEFASPDERYVMSTVNAYAGALYDPFLSKDALRLYLAPAPNGQKQRLAMAMRATRTSDFGAITELKNVGMANEIDADPALSGDELVLLFSSSRPSGAGGPGKTNLWYATRAQPGDDFGAPRLVPGVNGPEEDGDPQLSADGCTLYFASTRGVGNGYDLYSATMRP